MYIYNNTTFYAGQNQRKSNDIHYTYWDRLDLLLFIACSVLPSSATYITSDGMLFGSDRLVTINTKNWHDVAFAVI